jgi:ATP-dependent Zn protease
MAILHKLANTLLEKEVLDGHQIDQIIKGEMV